MQSVGGPVERIDYFRIGKILTIAAYPAGILGMAALAFPLGPIYLFPYRLIIPIIWLVFLIWIIKEKGKLVGFPYKTRFLILFLLFWLVYSVVSTNWAVDQISALKQVIFLFFSISLILFSVVFFGSADDLNLATKAWLVFLGLAFMVGMYETISGYHLPISSVSHTDLERFRYAPTAFFYNPNDFATFLSLSAPFLLSAVVVGKKAITRFLGLVSFGILLYLLVKTSSRANYLAVLMILVYFMIVAYFSQKTRKELYFLISSSLVIPLFFPNRILTIINEGILYFQGLLVGFSKGVGSLSVRVNLARNGFHFLAATWGFGVGAGNLESWMATRAIFDVGNIVNIHNWFLEVLVNYGIFVFAGYVFFYMSLIYHTYAVLRRHNQDHQMKTLGVALLGSLIGFFFASMSSSSIMALKPHWMIFALAISYVNLGLSKDPTRLRAAEPKPAPDNPD